MSDQVTTMTKETFLSLLLQAINKKSSWGKNELKMLILEIIARENINEQS